MPSYLNAIFASVFTIYSILVPGTTLVLLNAHWITCYLPKIDKDLLWIGGLILALIAGHLLLEGSGPLDGTALWLLSPRTKDDFRKAQQNPRLFKLPAPDVVVREGGLFDRISFPKVHCESEERDLFHGIFSFLRFHRESLVAHLERITSEYKLFRSLTLAFLIEAALQPVAPVTDAYGWWRSSALFLALAFACWWRFCRLFDETYQQMFQFYSLALRAPRFPG